jgi:hypothetical protein
MSRHHGRGWCGAGAHSGAGFFGSFFDQAFGPGGFDFRQAFGPRGFAFKFGWEPGDFRSWAGPSREEVIRWLEEYQRDLEQEISDVQARIRELRQEKSD